MCRRKEGREKECHSWRSYTCPNEAKGKERDEGAARKERAEGRGEDHCSSFLCWHGVRRSCTSGPVGLYAAGRDVTSGCQRTKRCAAIAFVVVTRAGECLRRSKTKSVRRFRLAAMQMSAVHPPPPPPRVYTARLSLLFAVGISKTHTLSLRPNMRSTFGVGPEQERVCTPKESVG